MEWVVWKAWFAMVKQKNGSRLLSSCSLVDILEHVAVRVPALSVGIIVVDAQGGANTSLIINGNAATSLGLGRLAYLMARKKSKEVLRSGEDMIDDEVCIPFEGEQMLGDMSISDLMDHVRNEADTLACGICIPDDGNSATTTTYLSGSAQEVKGLSDTLSEVCEDRCMIALEDAAEANRLEEDDEDVD